MTSAGRACNCSRAEYAVTSLARAGKRRAGVSLLLDIGGFLLVYPNKPPQHLCVGSGRL